MISARHLHALLLLLLGVAIPCAALSQEPDTTASTGSAAENLEERVEATHAVLMAAQRQPSDDNFGLADASLRQLESLTTASATPELHFFRARLAELRGDLQTAAEQYRAYVDADSGGRFGRIAYQRMRRLPALASAQDDDTSLGRGFELLLAGYNERGSDASVAMALELLEQATNPLFRADLLIWLGHEHQFQRTQPAISWHYYQQASLIEGLDNRRANAAISAMATLSGAAGTIFASRRQVRIWLHQNPDVLDAVQTETIVEELDDQFGNYVARWLSILTLPLLLAVFLLRRGWRAFGHSRRSNWSLARPLFFIFWMFAGASVIAYYWHPSNLSPIALCTPAVIVVHLLAGATARAGEPLRPAYSALLAVLVALCTLTAMYTVLAMANRTAFLGL
jgi:hypothetical protein